MVGIFLLIQSNVMFKDIDFKRALQELPEKEKDKLILRLLRRDMDLAEKLYFELVDTDSIEDKRRIMEINIFLSHVSNLSSLICTNQTSKSLQTI